MVETWSRVVGDVLRVGNEDVHLSVCEQYTAESPGFPVHVRITAPGGLFTQGSSIDAWREMRELLGIAPPTPPAPAITESPEPAQLSADPLPEPAVQEPTSLPTILPPVPSAPSPQVTLPSALDPESPQPLAEEEDEDVEPEDDDSITQPSFRQTFRETLLKLLHSPVEQAEDESDEADEDEPPCEVTRQDVAYIPKLATSGEAARFIHEVDRNIELLEKKADALVRAKHLAYLKKANRAKRCQHVRLNGHSCGSPALRGQKFCHFHTQAHAPSIDIPVIEDQRSLQLALTKVAQQVAANKIDAAQAKLLLQVLDIAGRNLPAEGI